jgi:hypothetical protein
MRRVTHAIRRHWGWLGLVVSVCSGCTDTASLCDARLIPINLEVAAVAPLPGKGPHQ